jgi:apolipoprotein N-acyltransferase
VAASVAVWGGAESVRTKGVITGLALATLAGLAVFGAIRLSTPTRFTALNLRIVQADIEQADKWSPEEFRAIYDAYTSLTAEPPIGGQPMPQVVLWPEGAIPADSAEFLAGATWTHDALMAALRPGQILIMGAERSDGDGSDPRYYNSALALRRDASGLTTVGVYDKHHLVPFGEYMPMAPVMKAIGFEALVHMGDGFTAGPRPATLTPPGLPGVEPLICYESLFPDFASGTPRAHWIANLSNDAWFGKTSGPWQHLNLASYRAIEAGLPMVRATPTGVSAVIDAYGRPLKTLGQGVRGVIDARLPQAIVAPAYRTLGEGPFWLAIVVILAAPAWRLLKVRFGERAG